jgi:hypothetical protein
VHSIVIDPTIEFGTSIGAGGIVMGATWATGTSLTIGGTALVGIGGAATVGGAATLAFGVGFSIGNGISNIMIGKATIAQSMGTAMANTCPWIFNF